MKKINKLIAGVASAAMIVTAFSACGSCILQRQEAGLHYRHGDRFRTFEDAAVHYRRV